MHLKALVALGFSLALLSETAAAEDCPEHIEAFGLRPGRVGETLTRI